MTVMEPITAIDAPAPAANDPKGALLAGVFDALDREGLPYCVLHGYEAYPEQVSSDVDVLTLHEMLPRRLGELLKLHEAPLDARIVQWFVDRAHFIVLAGRPAEAGMVPPMLQLHVSTDYEVHNRVVFGGNDVLRSRRRYHDRFWVPAAHVEFACVLVNRLAKGSLEPRHTRQLSSLWSKDPAKCLAEVERLFSPSSALLISAASEAGNWEPVRSSLSSLRSDVMGRLSARHPLSLMLRWTGRQFRRIGRWMSPQSGLHIVFLGPDGVGKSTVIDAVQERLAPAFLETKYETFARSILPTRHKASPYALPPRSFAGSLLKAAWWLMCYSLGYFKSVYPTVARGGLAINHRYMLDAIADPLRYRYSGPTQLLRWIWKVVPKPDLIFFLDAPAEVIQARKQEMTFDQTTRQRDAYLALSKTVQNAHVVDTNRPIEQSIHDVTEIILNHMSARVSRRLKMM